MNSGKPKSLDQFGESVRSRKYSRRAEQTYAQRVKRFIFFHNGHHPAEMSEVEINAFLTRLRPTSLPVIMTRDEIKIVSSNLSGVKWLMTSLMNGAGLLLMECLPNIDRRNV